MYKILNPEKFLETWKIELEKGAREIEEEHKLFPSLRQYQEDLSKSWGICREEIAPAMKKRLKRDREARERFEKSSDYEHYQNYLKERRDNQ